MSVVANLNSITFMKADVEFVVTKVIYEDYVCECEVIT